jgi:hypothetical protein
VRFLRTLCPALTLEECFDLYAPALSGLAPEEEGGDAGGQTAQQAAQNPGLAHVLRILVHQAALAPSPATA